MVRESVLFPERVLPARSGLISSPNPTGTSGFSALSPVRGLEREQETSPRAESETSLGRGSGLRRETPEEESPRSLSGESLL